MFQKLVCHFNKLTLTGLPASTRRVVLGAKPFEPTQTKSSYCSLSRNFQDNQNLSTETSESCSRNVLFPFLNSSRLFGPFSVRHHGTVVKPRFLVPKKEWPKVEVTPNYFLANTTYDEWKEQKVLNKIHTKGPRPSRKPRHPLKSQCQMKGIVLRTLVKHPKKPNSANRKCVLVRLSSGAEKVAFVPGEGHNLQEHSVVLVEARRVRDVPGLKIRVVRGARDCAHVVKKTQSR